MNVWAAQAEAFTLCLNHKDWSEDIGTRGLTPEKGGHFGKAIGRSGGYWKCEGSRKAFRDSCKMVASNTMKMSSKDNVVEYLNNICTKMTVGWHQATCQKAGTLIAAAMTANPIHNYRLADERAQTACVGLWEYSVAEQEAKAKAFRRAWNAPSKALAKAKEQGRWQLEIDLFEANKREYEKGKKDKKDKEMTKRRKMIKKAREDVAWRALGVLPLTGPLLGPLLPKKESAPESKEKKEIIYLQVQQSLQRENQRVEIMTTNEAHANSVRHLEEYDAHQKQMQDWATSQNVAINQRNAKILRIRADQERRKANLDLDLD